MKSQSNIRFLSILRSYVNVASIVTFGVGLMVMFGWFFGIPALKSFLPGVPAMRFNTALSFLLAGSSLWLLQNEEASHAKKRIGRALAGLVLLISLLTLSEYLFGWNLGIDELFVRDLDSPPDLFPGRMSPIAVLCAGLSSGGLLMLGSRISQYFSLSVICLSLLAIMNYLFDFQALNRHPEDIYAGTHASLTFLIVSLAIIVARPTLGMMRMLSSDMPGSKAMRLLLPAIVMLTILIGWLVERAENLGFLRTSKESIFLVILLIFVYSPLIYFIARNINQAEERIIYVNRLYATLSQVNQTIVRVKSQQELFESICKVAVDFGEFRLAWIGLFNSETGQVTPVAEHGDGQNKLPFQNINVRQAPFQQGLISAALQTEQVVFSNDVQTDPTMKHWRDLAIKDGYHSVAGVPIRRKGRILGLLNLYAADVGFFLVAEEQSLLEEMGQNISFALDAMQAEEAVRQYASELERRVEERTAELKHANRAKDEFLANMSHELRTPLTTILGLSESLLEQTRGPLNEHQQKSLQVLESSGRHLLELINDVLDLSKIGAGKLELHPESVDVLKLCEASLALIKGQASKKSIALEFQPEQAGYMISGDPRFLKQILVNLLTNAVKFTPEKGRVALEVSANAEEGLIQFSVNDNGIGIAPEDLGRLFHPFVQVDSSLNRQYEGTGLGLALIQRLTDLHGGSVHVESEVGKGSCFTVNLPWRPAAAPQQEITQPESELLTSEQAGIVSMEPIYRGIILLAEDNLANVLTIGEYLESYGYQIVVAHDGLEAIEKAEEIRPNIILMDIQMPAMDGLEAIRRLRADSRFTSTPIVALTALAMPGDRERCLEAGANEYLSKPASLKTLVKTIEQLLPQEE